MQVPAARIVFSENDKAEVARGTTEALRTGALTLGAHTREFEAAFAELHQVPFAVAVASGTAALEIMLRAVGGGGVAGADVVVPANTFFATAGAILHAGGRPVIADVDADTFALSPATVEAALTPQTRAVVVVHIGGLVSPATPLLRALCDERGISLIEDAAHAHGCSLGGRMAGTFGVAGGFSFYPTKVITSGEGGMIVTADERIRDEALVYRDQGKAGFLGNVHTRLGYAWRMSELHALVGKVHLRRLPEFLARREQVAKAYDVGLDGTGLTPLPRPDGVLSNHYKYVALLPEGTDRPAFKASVKERGVSLSGEVYELPLHKQPVLEHLATGPLPVAEDVCARHVCLPVHSDMSDAEVEAVLGAVSEVAAQLQPRARESARSQARR